MMLSFVPTRDLVAWDERRSGRPPTCEDTTMPVRTLKRFLDDHKIKYVTIKHSPAFTAKEIAASAHVAGKDLAKTVMIRVDGKMAMAVLPSTLKLDFGVVREALSANDVELATELDFKSLFPDCDVGAMPPFGNLYDMEVFVDEALTEDEEIAFNAGTHTELVKLSYRDFERLVKPTVVRLAALVG